MNNKNDQQIVLVDGQNYEIIKSLNLDGHVFQIKHVDTNKK